MNDRTPEEKLWRTARAIVSGVIILAFALGALALFAVTPVVVVVVVFLILTAYFIVEFIVNIARGFRR